MYLAGKRARLLAVVLAAVACTEQSLTAPTEAIRVEDLDLVLPSLSPDQFVARSILTAERAAGPMANPEPPPPEPDYWDTYEWPALASDIWNAKTRANFVPGRLSVIGSHDYMGNIGTISTTGTVTYQGQTVGTQTAYAERSISFLVAFLPNHIWTEARVYVDRECGLSGWGSSKHGASWQAVMGGPVSVFNPSGLTTWADRTYQPECAPEPFIPTGGTDDYSGDRMICHYWLEYDMYTGEVLDWWLIYCTGGG